MSTLTLSFVIPAKNEAKYIGQCLTSVKDHAGVLLKEIVVVDNGSSDDTPTIAVQCGAKVITRHSGTIGSLRNAGVNEATGDVIVFIDADVMLTPAWQSNIDSALANVNENSKYVTGSHCFAPESDPTMLRTWFNSFASEPNSRHLGTGHLIVGRQFFIDVGGFSEILRTGEDYEFCVRAERAGAKIKNDLGLVVYHLDFPKDLKSFVRREMWHGRGDLQSLQVALQSKVVMASFAFFMLHVALLIAMLLGKPVLFQLIVLLLAALLVASSWKKFQHRSISNIISNACVFYVYYWGRVLSMRYVFS